jgi:primosomal protein N' (replication factor Y)
MPTRQQTLFDAGPEAWELDAAELRNVATVVLAAGPDGTFDYEIPEGFADLARPDRMIEPGRRVRVPFGRGNRPIVGYCVETGTKPAGRRRLKAVAGVVDARRLFSPAMLRLTRWMADYYLSTWGQVLEAVAPAAVRRLAGTRQVKLLHLAEGVASRLSELPLRSPQQKKALEALAACEAPITAIELAHKAGCTTAPIQALVKAGLIEATQTRVLARGLPSIRKIAEGGYDGKSRAVPLPGPPRKGEGSGGGAGTGGGDLKLDLNSDQRSALDAILASLDAQEPRGLLLHGVTGSGKTEVYLQAIERVASFGRQAIVLVPEISLTPQTVRRFAARFDRVAVLHSHLSDVERHEHWQAIARGEATVIVGARSAVFAPTPHLGLIVIDEEHETTFKQDTAPRYHARDVAWQRAQAERVPLVLGSATPSLESWQRAATGELQRLSLPKRVLDLPMPQVMTVDLRDPGHGRGSGGALSRPLRQAMTAALRDGGQVLLLLNRRGFATHVQCPACGYVLKCADCDLAMTFHRQHNTALCHYCDKQAQPPSSCPDCKSPGILYGGMGTQKLEMEVRSRFPEYASARMDMDSTRKRGSHDAVLSAFQRGEIRILLGTQMIAKGLDFPNVTLVGVVNADTALHLPDFRAAERTFQLVAQVAGRTGRGRQGGRVLVQTLSPEHPAIAAAVRHDYQRFAEHELAIRRAAGYPPFSAMVRVVLRGPQEGAVRDAATGLGERFRAVAAGDATIRVLGPGAAPIARLRGEHRVQLQLQAPSAAVLQALVREATGSFAAPDSVRWTVDVDPWDMQ